MNKKRLKQINIIIDKISNISDEIEEVLSDEQDSFDNMPEGLQCSANGERSEAAIDALEESSSLISDVKELLEGIE